MSNNIESHLVEKRVFKPSKEFSRSAHIGSFAQYRKLYKESIKAPERFWAKQACRPALAKEVDQGQRLAAALRQVVCWRQAQHFRELSGSSPCGSAPQQGGDHLGRRTRRTPGPYLSATSSRSLHLRKHPQTQRLQEGRSRAHLSAAHPRGGCSHACLRSDRSCPQRGLRRIQQREHQGSVSRQRGEYCRHRGWRLSARPNH